MRSKTFFLNFYFIAVLSYRFLSASGNWQNSNQVSCNVRILCLKTDYYFNHICEYMYYSYHFCYSYCNSIFYHSHHRKQISFIVPQQVNSGASANGLMKIHTKVNPNGNNGKKNNHKPFLYVRVCVDLIMKKCLKQLKISWFYLKKLFC